MSRKRAVSHQRRRGRFSREARGASLVRFDEQSRNLARSTEAARRRVEARQQEVPSDPGRVAFAIRRAEELAEITRLITKTKAREERRAKAEHEAARRDEALPMLSSEWSPSRRT